MRSVVCCDVINLLAFAIHNGRPQRYAVLPRLEILARSFAIYRSLHLSLPNLPPYLLLFSIQILIQFAHQRNTSTLHESIGMGPLPGINTSFFSLWLCICHYFAVSQSWLLPSGYILFGWPAKVTIYCVPLLTAWK